jgi:hypothetical protein
MAWPADRRRDPTPINKFDGCRVTLMDPAKTGLLEVAIDPKRIGVDD